MSNAIGYAALHAKEALAPFKFTRRNLGPRDVSIEIFFCGICHTDIHQARNEWGGTPYPLVPGHEIIGKIQAVGSDIKHLSVADWVGVGCMINACRHCPYCLSGQEPYCDKGWTPTAGGLEKDGLTPTFGGYSDHIVVDADFVFNMPSNANKASLAPLLCAGITTFSPLKHWQVGPGQVVGIIGLGGLGHLAVKFAKALGARVVVFTSSISKSEDAHRLGADDVVVTTHPDAFKKHLNTLDFMLSTLSATQNMDQYLGCLKTDKTLVLVGIPDKEIKIHAFQLVKKRRNVAGSLIGGIAETQHMLDFCEKHNISADVEVIAAHQINEAYERILKGDIKYRFVIDMKTLKN